MTGLGERLSKTPCNSKKLTCKLYTQWKGFSFNHKEINQVEILTQQSQNNQRNEDVTQQDGDELEGEHHGQRQG